jgi:hypothetical protein
MDLLGIQLGGGRVGIRDAGWLRFALLLNRCTAAALRAFRECMRAISTFVVVQGN